MILSIQNEAGLVAVCTIILVVLIIAGFEVWRHRSMDWQDRDGLAHFGENKRKNPDPAAIHDDFMARVMREQSKREAQAERDGQGILHKIMGGGYRIGESNPDRVYVWVWRWRSPFRPYTARYELAIYMHGYKFLDCNVLDETPLYIRVALVLNLKDETPPSVIPTPGQEKPLQGHTPPPPRPDKRIVPPSLAGGWGGSDFND